MLSRMQTFLWKSVLSIGHMAKWALSSFGGEDYLNPTFKIYENEEPVEIIAVHGTADRSKPFVTLLTRLMESKLPRLVSYLRSISFEGRAQGKSIEEFAEQLRDQLVLNKVRNVILMGHSRGGCVVSYFAEYLAKAAGINVIAVIPICSPFKGSKFALWPFTFSRSVQEMQVDSEFLEQLNKKISVSSHLYFPYAAEDDYLVSTESSAPHESKAEVIGSGHGHLSVMTSNKLAESIVHHIQQLVPDPELAYSSNQNLLFNSDQIETKLPKKKSESKIDSPNQLRTK